MNGREDLPSVSVEYQCETDDGTMDRNFEVLCHVHLGRTDEDYAKNCQFSGMAQPQENYGGVVLCLSIFLSVTDSNGLRVWNRTLRCVAGS